MFRLSFLILILISFTVSLHAQSPHGPDLKLDCSVCHNSTNWKVDFTKTKFDHETTGFTLVGQHNLVDCKSCHTNLVFTQADPECSTCHTDIHQETVGLDCSKCHTPKSWMVEDINGIHQVSRFPLVGNHLTADCAQCHTRYIDLYFEPLDIDCFSCHEQDYISTASPNHTEAGFSTDCMLCHSINADVWAGASIIHDFFPLVGGHAIQDCFACHEQGGNFTGLTQECYSCHQQDYENTDDPNHVQAGFPTECEQCHNIYGWSPANFDHNQTQFPLTGKHINVNCSDCHTDGFAGTPTDCYSCHQQDYESASDPNHVAGNFPTDCSECHTTDGWEGANFNHNQTNFPLTGAHMAVDCASCHINGFAGTPTDCYSCHQQNYESVQDPNHIQNNFSLDCTQCHTTNNWIDVTFDHSNTNFELTGAHITIDCSSCHQNGYAGTPTDCFSCHSNEYNNTTNPDHQAANFPNTCEDCHTTTAWIPANFDHDGQYFPIYSGKHNGKWDVCIDCHTIPTDYAIFSCIDCHEHNNKNEVDNQHQGVQGYIYESNACYDCHPTGEKEGAFNHSLSNFPLTGAHIGLDCQQCHENGYINTPVECVACHQQNYNESTNPNHQALSLPTDCESCHTTNPNWEPASFSIHNQFYELIGAHASISDNCNDCHNGDYNNTPVQCFGCHESNYSEATNPNHIDAGISTECEPCHNPIAWTPSTFNHATTGFELLGQHATIQCSACHVGTTIGLDSQCFSCHEADYNAAPNHLSQNFPTNCEICHNATGWSEVTFNHANTNFPLTGAHQNVDCTSCHETGYTGTTTVCYDCHQTVYAQSTNPDHQALSLPTDCESCHTTNPGWEPASFPIHNQFYELIGAHASISENCIDCHNGNYNNTPNTCFGCHESAYNNANDPPHQQLNFSQDCLECHNQNSWTPANFNHNFYPLSGNHNNVNCNECHSQTAYQPQCISCHLQDFLEGHNSGDPEDCWNCHTTSNWDAGGLKIKRVE